MTIRGVVFTPLWGVVAAVTIVAAVAVVAASAVVVFPIALLETLTARLAERTPLWRWAGGGDEPAVRPLMRWEE